MFDTFPSPDDTVLMAAAIVGLVRQVEPAVWLYLAAALVAAFWHRHMWLIYLGLALAGFLSGWRSGCP